MAETKPNIIGIDDNSAMITLLKKSVEKLAVLLHPFHSAEEAYEHLQSHEADLIITSILLPGKDGLTFIEELRQLPAHRETKIVIVSFKDYKQDMLTAKKHGVLKFIPKPVPVDTITDTIIEYTGASLQD